MEVDIQYPQPWRDAMIWALTDVFQWPHSAANNWLDQFERWLRLDPRGQGMFSWSLHRSPEEIVIGQIIRPRLTIQPPPGELIDFFYRLEELLGDARATDDKKKYDDCIKRIETELLRYGLSIVKVRDIAEDYVNN